MEEIISTVLSLIVVLALLALIRRWGGPSAAPRPAMAGALVVPLSPMVAACPARRRDPFSCLGCGLRQQCWGLKGVPAAEEIAGRPGGIVGGNGVRPDPGADLERVERLLKAAGELLGRFVDLLNVLPIHQVAPILGRLLRLLLARASG